MIFVLKFLDINGVIVYNTINKTIFWPTKYDTYNHGEYKILLEHEKKKQTLEYKKNI